MDSSTSHYGSPALSDIDNGPPDLTDQLLNSPESRFHAAYLFMRFFDIVFGTQEMRQKDKVKGLGLFSRWDIDGSELVTWDVAIACLALSVKLHRDFLAPLFPVYSFQFEDLAPHYIEYEDLEAAQRDILFALSYNLGGTPQGILDELWIALPSLQRAALLQSRLELSLARDLAHSFRGRF
ncbi:hypothetical protein BT96DRAFT_723851 [Gymnopus androsaceus JB14]|uniref:Cyclin N-terminal domain-containing protein n=1 Tax=Gymnopus androsaceus JB14 TaxID=1447944 RepID=A0A6A4HMJ1_9AGAR|nr:hypothetical protein BT96DRAFT_723851 [Gymnopus androsaceus JB14]